MTAEPATSRMLAADKGARERAGHVRLRTLVLFRWAAVGGQASALLVVYLGFGFPFPLVPTFAVVMASAVLNIAATVRHPPRKRLSDRQAALYLAYDIAQLAVLLFLTGGLGNPFALLMLVPVTISANILGWRSTIWLAALSLAFITLLAAFHLPLPWKGGGLVLDRTYIVGTWVALSLGLLFLSGYASWMARDARRITEALAETRMALAREQQISALGSLAAAAAHELATPLGTIAMVAREIARDLPPDSGLTEDVELLQGQAGRCREILKRLSSQPGTSDEAPFSELPLAALVAVAADPHRRNDTEFEVIAPDGVQPIVRRSPELVQGLGNLIENALDFAQSQVWLGVDWDEAEIRIEITDDGPGFPGHILGVLGEPYVSARKDKEGMGLGVFIARTLLERTGASLDFSNPRDGGARVAVTWPREVLEVAPAAERAGRPASAR